MAIVNVTGIMPANEMNLTRSGSPDAELIQDTYVFPVEQDYLSITNAGDYDIVFNVGGYTNITLHKGQTWSNNVDFTSFDIWATIEPTTFIWTSKEYDTTPININKLWSLMALRDKAEDGDMIVTVANAGSSAAAVNADIADEGKLKFTRTVSVALKNTETAVHDWFNGNFAVAVETNSVAGIVEVTSNFLTLIDGEGTIDLEYTGTWLEGETTTLTITGGTKFGYAITDKTSVDTLIA
jgi:hypothetical protein